MAQAPCPTDFFGVKPADFHDCFTYYAARKYWPETLSGGNTMAGSFQPGSERPVYIYMTHAQFQQRFNDFAAKGFFPHQFSALSGGVDIETENLLGFLPVGVTSSSIPPLFTCIWKPVTGPAETRMLPVADFATKNQTMAAAGFVLHDLCGYSEDASGKGIRMAATWTKRPHGAFTQYVNMTYDQALAHYNQLAPQGYQITRFCGYNADHKWYYAAIYEKIAGEWYHFFNMTGQQFQAKYNELAPRHLPIRHVCHYGNLYSVVWGHPV